MLLPKKQLTTQNSLQFQVIDLAKCELISVGTEILLGDILNTDAQFLSQELAKLGINVMHQSTIGDNHDRLITLLNESDARRYYKRMCL